MSDDEAQLRLLEAAVYYANESILITTAELNQPGPEIVFVNPAFTRITGYTAQEVMGKTPRILQGQKTDRNVLDKLRADLTQGQVFYGEVVNYRKDGTEFNLEWHVAPIHNQSGETTHYISIQRDITERKRKEQKIREQAALLDVSADAIIVSNLENQIVFWNKGAERLYGWTVEEALALDASEFLFQETSSQLQAAQKTVSENGSWQGELEQKSKQGKQVIVSSRWSLVRDEQGQPKSILVVNTDITERKQLEAQLFRAQRLESLGTLASGIAHDLNNVLAPILMSVQLFEMRFTDEQSQRILQLLTANVKRGAALVKQVLEFARGVEGERTILQVSHVLQEVQQIAQQTFPKSIEVHLDTPSDLWTISANATQIHQVLMNLCVNAHDAMPNGGSLNISAENLFVDEHYARMHLEASVGDYIVITVTDTGTGIVPEILEKVFDPFFTTKEFGKGTGLGLATVIGIIKSHGGFVNVYSQVGSGTRFKVYLPAVSGTQKQQAKDVELLTGHGELILVVDDEAPIREITKTSLETYNYKVLTASDGVEALALYVQHKDEIAVVLVDMMMPLMDGTSTIRALRKINSAVKVIAISGLVSNQKITEAASIGSKAFLLKPCTAKELLHTINAVLSAK